jgi:hypothetical protein
VTCAGSGALRLTLLHHANVGVIVGWFFEAPSTISDKPRPAPRER